MPISSDSARRRTRLAAMIPLAFAAIAGAAAVANAQTTATSSSQSNAELSALSKARIDSAQHLYVAADVAFMSGMIHHHSQAITMSAMAPTHGASQSVQTLASRIINAQTDEIATMQQWLRDRGQPVPDPKTGAHMDMPGVGMSGMNMSGSQALMPGMLTDAQMKALDAARGRDFDELFLRGMIQHHSGAVSMVKDLFASQGAALDEQVFKFASDVNVDQTTEIARMQRMLVMLLLEPKSPSK